MLPRTSGIIATGVERPERCGDAATTQTRGEDFVGSLRTPHTNLEGLMVFTTGKLVRL
jgi:hypothetical protein